METIICFVGFIFIIIISILISISNGMGKMSPKSNEETVGMPYGAKFKDDCNNDDSWVG